jgi:hypothetical protein
MKEENANTKDSTSNLEKIITRDITYIDALLTMCDHYIVIQQCFKCPAYRKKETFSWPRFQKVRIDDSRASGVDALCS